MYVENDSGGMSILASSVVDRVLADGRANDASFAAAHEAVLVRLEGDDSFIARVVADEPLTAEEQAQWICRIQTRLKVPGGRLLVCGGFDPRSLEEFKMKGPSSTVREVQVPPGEYRVDVYTQLSTMTGRILRERWDEKIGAWFRRDHRGRPFPSWLAGELSRSPEDDPGHEKEWGKLKPSVASKKLRVETSPLDWVGYVIHLQASDDKAQLSPTDRGWFATDVGFRRPARFPLGLPAVGAQDPEVRYELQAILPRRPTPKPAPPLPGRAAPVLQRLPEPVPIDGGAIIVPAEHIDRLARIAWFCDRDVDAAVMVTLPPGAKWAPRMKAGTPAIVSADGTHVQVGFPEVQGPNSTLAWTGDLGRSLGKLPDGAVLDVGFADTGSPEVTSGNHRWRGMVRGGRWSVTQAWPAVQRVTVDEALALVDELKCGKGIRARDVAEAEAVRQGATGDEYLSGVEVARRGLVLTVAKSMAVYLPYIARVVFRRRLGGAWNLASDEARATELRDLMDDAFGALTKALTPVVESFVVARATGTFKRGDLRRLKGVDPQRLSDFDERFRSVGLQPLGDLVFEFAPEITVRAYGAQGATTYGSLMWPPGGEPQVDVFTRFSDGSSVTTTTTPGVQDIEAAKIFRGSFPGEPANALWRRHRAAVERRLSTGCRALPAEPTLPAFAQAVDDFFERQRVAMR
ncbi:MAG TPA: hypothetical protein VLG10_04595 [Methylomirabilota bacterium]|nr:hypothetical protein [Methylomirabilota bacterium]